MRYASFRLLLKVGALRSKQRKKGGLGSERLDFPQAFPHECWKSPEMAEEVKLRAVSGLLYS